MSEAKVTCYFLDVESLEADFDHFLSLLPKERQQRCMRYLHTKDRLLSLGGGLLIEAFVGKGPYLFNKYGKPYKEGCPRFSLSHSGSYALLAVCADEVGADIERIGGRDSKLIEYCFDEDERARIKSEEDFFLSWCEKEALGKLIGFGIKDPKKTPVQPLSEGKVAFEGGCYYVQKGVRGGYAYAFACESPFVPEIVEADVEQLKALLK